VPRFPTSRSKTRSRPAEEAEAPADEPPADFAEEPVEAEPEEPVVADEPPAEVAEEIIPDDTGGGGDEIPQDMGGDDGG
jgi:hypothetical protein